ncbi:ATPase RavA domain protein, partial [Vibrio parahaemolyticus V-223/04]
MREVVQEFALKHAFDQQDAEQEIEYCRESLIDVQHELEDTYRMTLTSEAATGILRKETMRFDTSKAKTYKVGAAVN